MTCVDTLSSIYYFRGKMSRFTSIPITYYSTIESNKDFYLTLKGLIKITDDEQIKCKLRNKLRRIEEHYKNENNEKTDQNPKQVIDEIYATKFVALLKAAVHINLNMTFLFLICFIKFSLRLQFFKYRCASLALAGINSNTYYYNLSGNTIMKKKIWRLICVFKFLTINWLLFS